MTEQPFSGPVAVDAPDGTFRAEFVELTTGPDGDDRGVLRLTPGTPSETEITVPADRLDDPRPFDDAVYTVRIANGLLRSVQRIRSTTD